ncbi:ABC transporter substrate-binding protein [Corticibacter populi]|nr:ABC transporter substrate-binding protein [Corticibacter populi]RZS34954.1 NitT/TauT family transport system substrate-binding protein [Corticibacter populi]
MTHSLHHRTIDPSRRRLLRGAAALAVGAPLIGVGLPSLSRAQQPTGEVIKVGWNGSGICLISQPVAQAKGFFEKHGANVEFVNFGSGFAQGVEAVAAGKVDTYVNFILQYLKPLEQGVAVKFTGTVHGGCIRVLAKNGAQEVDYATLKGKSIGVPSIDNPAKQFLSVELQKVGINPQNEVEWKVFPNDLLGEALSKGEVQAVSGVDPAIYVTFRQHKDEFAEIGGLHFGEHQQLACCAIGVREEFVQNRRGDAAAFTRALLESAQWVSENPDEAAEIFTQYSPIERPILAEIIRSHTHDVHYPAGDRLVQHLSAYGKDLQEVGILRRRTDVDALARKVSVDVLS